MSITNGYATLVQLQDKIGNNSSTYDSKFEQAIEEASRIIDSYAGLFFYELDLTTNNETIDCYGYSSNSFYVSSNLKSIWAPAPITSITSITEDSTTLTQNTDYYVYNREGRIDSDGSWSTERKSIVFSGKIGYTSATLPKDITSACLSIAQILTGLATTMFTDQNGDITEIVKNSIPMAIWKMLDKYKRYDF